MYPTKLKSGYAINFWWTRVFFVVTLLLPTIDALTRHHTSPAEIGHLLFWSAILCVIPGSLPRRAFLVVVTCAWLLTPLIIALLGYIALDGTMPSIENVRQTLDETNVAEAISAFGLAFQASGFIAWLMSFFACLVAVTVMARLSRETKWQAADAQPVLALSLFLLVTRCLSVHFFPASIPPWILSSDDFRMNVVGQLSDAVLLEATDRLIETPTAQPQHALARETARITSPSLSMLVIGESMRADALGPLTAHRGPWSAELEKRTEQGLALWLPSACAAHDSTVISVPALITGTAPDQLLEPSTRLLNKLLGSQTNGDDLASLSSTAATAPTGLSRLQSAGYDVAWIASGAQNRFGGPEVSNGRGFFWSSPTGHFFSAGSSAAPLDEELLPAVSKFSAPLKDIRYAGHPKAIVVHLFGDHFLYQDRYPIDLFEPEPANLSDEDLQNVRYDRASEYGAKNLSSIAQLLDELNFPAFALYTSDHGDNLIRDHNGLLGHVAVRTSLAGDLVPVFIMWNKAASETGAMQKITSALLHSKRLAQIDIYHLWMSASGLDEGRTVEPTQRPMVFGAIEAGDKFSAVACSDLKP